MKALYIPDTHVRQMVEHVKTLHNFNSLRETVEAGMRSLIQDSERKKQSFEAIAASLQAETRKYLLDNYPVNTEHDHKSFFDELNGEI